MYAHTHTHTHTQTHTHTNTHKHTHLHTPTLTPTPKSTSTPTPAAAPPRCAAWFTPAMPPPAGIREVLKYKPEYLSCCFAKHLIIKYSGLYYSYNTHTHTHTDEILWLIHGRSPGVRKCSDRLKRNVFFKNLLKRNYRPPWMSGGKFSPLIGFSENYSFSPP